MIKDLINTFETHSDASIAKGMSKYMKNKFEYYGLKSPVRKELSAPFYKELVAQKYWDKDLVLQLWQMPQRELHYFALEYTQKMHKYWPEDIADTFECLILTKSWWDSVDTIASNLVGQWAKKNWQESKKTLATYITHPDMWMNRTAIICQLKYKDKVDTNFLTQAILPHKESKEFFHQKAIGWALREYAKVNPRWVWEFLDLHTLKPLSVREATKHFKV